MSLAKYLFRLSEAKRKNAPELMGLFNGGIPSFVWRANPEYAAGGVPIFCYHLAEPKTFFADLQFLSTNRYTTLNAEALLNHLTDQCPAPPRSVVMTFDDGGATLFNVAFPLLQKFGHRLIAFVCPGLHSETTDGGLCSWSQLKEMQLSGLVDVQSHSLEHRLPVDWPRPLPLAGVDNVLISQRRVTALTMEQDFLRARNILEQRLDKPVRHLAFPAYKGTHQAVKLARQAGYAALYGGTTARSGLNRAGQSLEKIGRISSEFVRRLPGNGRQSLLAVVRHRLRPSARTSSNNIANRCYHQLNSVS